MAFSDSELERWDLYPFGERSPSKSWDRVAAHPAWVPSLAEIAPHYLSAYQSEGDRLTTNYYSTVWGYRVSSVGIKIAAYLFARIGNTAVGRTLRVLRCLTYEPDREALYRKIRWYLTGLGMMQKCRRIEWEILDPATVALPATFDLIGPSHDPDLASHLMGHEFRVGGRWVYRRGPIALGGAPLEDTERLSRMKREWKRYAHRHFAALLPDPIPDFDPSTLDRFLPAGAGSSLFFPFGGGPVGQWCPDLKPLVESRGRWEVARSRVSTLRLLRFLPAPPTMASESPSLRLPESAVVLFPGATALEVGPLPAEDPEQAAWWESAGFSESASLNLMTCSL